MSLTTELHDMPAAPCLQCGHTFLIPAAGTNDDCTADQWSGTWMGYSVPERGLPAPDGAGDVSVQCKLT